MKICHENKGELVDNFMTPIEEHELVQLMKQVDDSSELIHHLQYRSRHLVERLKTYTQADGGYWQSEARRDVVFASSVPIEK